MLRYNLPALTAKSTKSLDDKQKKVDIGANRKAQYDIATAAFKAKAPKACFDEIKSILDRHSPPGQACYYCERDRYRDIDHIWPKRFYPSKAFQWENYVYACTICNQDAKNDRFAVFDANYDIVEFDRRASFDDDVPVGPHVVLDIRAENPLDFLNLDLITGVFTPNKNDPIAFKRGEYTRKLFKLDSDALTRIRRQAYEAFKNYITKYIDAAYSGDVDRAERAYNEILALPFPTVLREMRRQSSTIPELHSLFLELPPEIGQDH